MDGSLSSRTLSFGEKTHVWGVSVTHTDSAGVLNVLQFGVVLRFPSVCLPGEAGEFCGTQFLSGIVSWDLPSLPYLVRRREGVLSWKISKLPGAPHVSFESPLCARKCQLFSCSVTRSVYLGIPQWPSLGCGCLHFSSCLGAIVRRDSLSCW